MRRTLTSVRAFRIDADAVLARLRVLTLVDVRAVAASLVQGVATVTDTPALGFVRLILFDCFIEHSCRDNVNTIL